MCLPARAHPKLSDVLPSSASANDYPLVAIQLPMMNEIQCCESAIECACSQDWPKSRLIVQVLDDSTDKEAQIVIDNCIQKWHERGVQIKVYRRRNQHGFKAGNLNFGMSFIGHTEYVAIFDVDFLPTKDYLHKTIPNLIQDSTVAYVQTLSTFTNAKETLLTRMQEISQNFYYKCEQEGRFRASVFLNFQGSGGVWRTSVIKNSGGWHTDILSEDVDLSARVYINGWRPVFMNDVECPNELPSTVSAYITQQHRWTSGHMQVLKKLAVAICQSKHICWYQKLSCLSRILRTSAHLINFISLTVMVPINVLIFEKESFGLINMFLIGLTSYMQILFTFDEAHLIILHTLFLNAMSCNQAWSIISALFNLGRAHEWGVTPKSGAKKSVISLTESSIDKDTPRLKRDKRTFYASYGNTLSQTSSRRLFSIFSLVNNYFRWVCQRMHRKFRFVHLHKRNLLMAIYLLIISYLAFEKGIYLTAIYIFSTSVMCFILAFNCIGNQVEQDSHAS